MKNALDCLVLEHVSGMLHVPYYSPVFFLSFERYFWHIHLA